MGTQGLDWCSVWTGEQHLLYYHQQDFWLFVSAVPS